MTHTVPPGRVAFVLHTHMPYVEGYGTWPFGEEWLWEVIATTYLPLLDLFEGTGCPLTLSLTPVLCDQLAAPGVRERCLAFLHDTRRVTHARDAEGCRASGRSDLADELERAAGEYERAAERLDGLDLVGALAPYAAWTSAATHAVLPLLATDAGVRLQLETGIASHRARFGDGWRGGLWLPECAYEPWLDPLLEQAGVHAVCVDLHDVLPAGDPRRLAPLRTADGPLLVPIDRELVDAIWAEDGYPGAAAYRDSHRRTTFEHRPWANDGAVYDAERGRAQAQADAADLVSRCHARIAGGGLCVLALDTELFGHWWHEGPAFLSAFVAEAARTGLPLVPLDDALRDVPALPAPSDLPPTSWGHPRTLWTWSNPRVADIAVQLREAELRVVARGRAVGTHAARELLAVQASDWAFMESGDLAGPYPRERLAGHLAELDAALAITPGEDAPVRNLAPFLTIDPLVEV